MHTSVSMHIIRYSFETHLMLNGENNYYKNLKFLATSGGVEICTKCCKCSMNVTGIKVMRKLRHTRSNF